jgi:hypothetical protein
MVIDKLRERGLEVELLECNSRYVDPEHPFLSCEIDFELRLSGALEIGGIEWVFGRAHQCDAKSVTGFARKKWGEEDSEDVPIEYAAQFMHGLMVTGPALLPGRGAALVRRRRHLLDGARRRDDRRMRDEARELLARSRAAPTSAGPVDVQRHQGAVPLDNGLDVDATPGGRRQGRPVAHDQGAS